MNENTERLNLQIRHFREEKGLTLAQLAKLVGISTAHLSQLERGIKNLNNKHLARLSQALEVTPADLISISDNSGQNRPAATSNSDNDSDAVTPILSKNEEKLLKMFRRLTDCEKNDVLASRPDHVVPVIRFATADSDRYVVPSST